MPNLKTFSTTILLIIESSKIIKNDHFIEELTSQIDDWNTFIKQANAHGVLPLVYSTLKKHSTLIPIDAIKTMKFHCTEIAKQNMLMTSELIKIMKLLEDNNIKAISLKGPALSQMVFGDIVSRQYVDLDILIDEINLYDAAKLLTFHNYKSDSPISLLKNRMYLKVDNDFSFFTPNNVHIELHWKLFREKIGLNRSFNEYFEDHISVDINNNSIKTLSTEMLLVYLCLHGSKHAWERIEWINDINMLISNNKIDWIRVINIAGIMESKISLFLGLNISNILYNTEMPKNILVIIKSTYINKLTEEVFQFIESDLVNNKNYMIYKKINSFQSRLLETKKQKIQHFIFTYFSITKNDYLAFPLPSWLRGLYYIIKPFRIINKMVLKGK